MLRNSLKAFLPVLIVLTCVGLPLPASAGNLRAGAARVDISPTPDEFPFTAVGHRHIAPYIGVHDPVYARALFLDDGSTQVEVLVVDVTAIPSPGKFLSAVAKGVGLPESNVFIAASHTHSVPLVNYHLDLPYQVGEASPAQLHEIDRLIAGSIDAARQAEGHSHPARVSFGRGEAFLNLNSENPHGPSDKSLDVLRVEGTDGTPIALLVDYSLASTVTMNNYKADGGILVSGDLFGAAARLIEAQTPLSQVVLFASSSDGDQRAIFEGTLPKVGIVPASDAAEIAYTVMEVTARNLANVALSVINAMPQGTTDVKLSAASRIVTCPGARYSLDQQTKQMVVKEKPPVHIPLNLITINDIALAGVGGNLAAVIGQKIKSDSPFPQTTVIGGTAGSIGYILADSSYSKYSHSLGGDPLKEGCAEKSIVRELGEMLRTAKH